MDQLIIQFELIRKQMVDKAKKLGIQHPEVIELSKSLDLLHNKMLKIRPSL